MVYTVYVYDGFLGVVHLSKVERLYCVLGTTKTINNILAYTRVVCIHTAPRRVHVYTQVFNICLRTTYLPRGIMRHLSRCTRIAVYNLLHGKNCTL